jgi:transcriptional regulator with XRE-family HTH domain
MLEKKYHPVDICVGKQLRKRRLKLAMSQEELAKNVHLTFQQIQKYEKGYNRISSSMLYDLAKALTVPITYFFEGTDIDCEYTKGSAEVRIKGIGNQIKMTNSDRELNELISYYQSITDKKLKSQILMLVKAFSKK